MCGFLGIWDFHNNINVSKFVQSLTYLKHRGPDDEGYLLVNTAKNLTISARGIDTQAYFSNLPTISSQIDDYNLILGFRRLSILDLTPSGHQPMPACSDRYWIVFNGEIYNYLELRQELEKQGYQFKSSSDTEVILASYQQWGANCLSYFNGMWSLAIWDSLKKELFLARDRFGVKPFYYFLVDRLLVFASEIKPLLKYIQSEPNLSMIYNYLTDGSLDTLPNQTFFSNIYCLPPGHFAIINSSSYSVAPQQYWYWPAFDEKISVSQEEAIELVRDLLQDAVQLRLRSDVPVGSSLSGGIDSSSIVCLIQAKLNQDKHSARDFQHTISSVFPGLLINEEKWIDKLTSSLNLQSHKTYPEPQEMERVFSKMIWHMEEPLGSASSFAQWSIFKEAKNVGLTVMLDGQGSDEIFAGYEYLVMRYITGLIEQGNYLLAIKESLSWKSRVNARLRHLLVEMIKELKLFQGVASFKRAFIKSKPPRFTTNELTYGHMNAAQAFNPHYGRARLSSELINTLTSYSLPQILRRLDRNSMAFSIEARTPFMDYRLVSLALRLPDKYKIYDGWTKYVLRQAMKGIVPDEFRWRKDKVQFAAPDAQWLKSSLRPMVESVFHSSALKDRGWLDQKEVSCTYHNFINGSRPVSSSLIWRWLDVEVWAQTFLDKQI